MADKSALFKSRLKKIMKVDTQISIIGISLARREWKAPVPPTIDLKKTRRGMGGIGEAPGAIAPKGVGVMVATEGKRMGRFGVDSTSPRPTVLHILPF